MRKLKLLGFAIVTFAIAFVLPSCENDSDDGSPAPEAKEYTITYELNGGTNNEGNPATYTVEDLPLSFKSPEKEGFEFAGWYEDSGFSGSAVSQITISNIGYKTLYAKWVEVKVGEFTKDTVKNIGSDCNNKTIKVIGEIDNDTISTLKEKVKTLEGITLDLSETTGITSIGSYAFQGCTGLTSVTIPNSVTSIESSAFQGCTGLESVTIPNSVTSIESAAFHGCTKLTSVEIPNSVESIGQYAFYGCTGLKSVTIPDSVTSIGERAFYGCTNVTIQGNIATIGSNAFFSCENITFTGENTAIGDNMFKNNTKLKTVVIGNIASVGASAFYGCKNLTSVTIGNVTSIGQYAFYDCTGLTRVDASSIEDWLGISFSNTASNPLYYAKHLYVNGTEVTKLVIPNGTTTIGQYAFYCCEGITSVEIPSSVTSIGQEAFDGCSGLTRVDASSIEDWLGISFSNNVSNPLYYAKHLYVNGTELTSLDTFPSSITTIGNYVFAGWGVESVTIPGHITSIGNGAFCNCTGLTSVTIPNSVTSIGWSAFQGCTGLTSVTIPSSVTFIGDCAFACYSLETVTFEDTEGWWWADWEDENPAPTEHNKLDVSNPTSNANKMKESEDDGPVWNGYNLYKGSIN